MQTTTRRILSMFSRIQFNKVDIRVQNRIGFLEMNSQKDFNALSADMKAALIDGVQQFEKSPEVKVIVLQSKLKKAFCAGANIKEFTGKKSSDFVNNDIFAKIHDTFYNAQKPIIAGVNGVALGGGCELALLCDMIFCSEEARFALPELRLGLIPGIGGTQRMARVAGRINTMRYVLTSEFINAKRAYQMGMVSEVFQTAELHSKVLEVATEITNKPLTAILAAKKVIKESENLSMRDGVDLERKVFYPLYDTPGMKEGVAAFIEKRKPNHYDL